jgi:hypothetical protein
MVKEKLGITAISLDQSTSWPKIDEGTPVLIGLVFDVAEL